MDDVAGAAPLPRGESPARGGRSYEHRVVGFLDMLGAKAARASERFLNDLGFTIASEEHQLALWSDRERHGFRTTWFSDNLGVSMPLPADEAESQQAFDTVAWYVGSLQAHLLSAFGIASRGGLAVGPCHHSGHMIFGSALVDAYTAESKQAKVPRILLDESAMGHVTTSGVPMASDDTLAGLHIDFLRIGMPEGARTQEAYLGALREAIVQGACAPVDAGDDPAKVLSSWEWLAARFDELVATRDAPVPIGRPEGPPDQPSAAGSRENDGRSPS